jgi:hypothetical protein
VWASVVWDMRGSDSAEVEGAGPRGAPGSGVRRLRVTHTEHVASECAPTAYETPSPYVSGGVTSNHMDLYDAMGISSRTVHVFATWQP